MNDNQIRLTIPQASYTLFDATRDGLPEVIVVNEALLSFEHIAIFPWHLCVTMEVADLAENGMPSPDESELLFEIGEEIESTVLDGRTTHGADNALFLCRSTWNAIRELRFLVHDPEVAHQALQDLLGSRDWQRGWEYEMSEDFAWEKAGHVFQLFAQARPAS